jgi:hypothetical protein
MPDHVHLVLFILNDWDDHMGSPLQGNLKNKGKHTVSDIMDWFKTMTTNEYIRMVREGYLPPFQKNVWERDNSAWSAHDKARFRRGLKRLPYKDAPPPVESSTGRAGFLPPRIPRWETERPASRFGDPLEKQALPFTFSPLRDTRYIPP